MKRDSIGLGNVDRACPAPWEEAWRPQSVAGVPHAWGKACLRRSHGRTVVPFAMDEPPQASWDLSVTADANCLCTVTAIPSPWSPETCPWSSDGEESGQE